MKTTIVLMLLALASTQSLATTPADDAAWTAWNASIQSAMRASNDPRQWALAAFPPSDDVAAPEATADADAELARAAAQAPNDALVQWIVANTYVTTDEKRARVEAALSRLEAIEPDNAAVWMQVLHRASKQHDGARASRAIARMAKSTRFDEHFADTLHAWLDIYDRAPAPPLPAVPDEKAGMSSAFASAMARASAVAMPSYATITNACNPDKCPVDDVRRSQCEAIGRQMLHASPTLIARAIGFVLLRNLDALTDADRAENRNLDWYRANIVQEGNAAAMRAFESDWRRSDDEIAVIRDSLRRAGLPTQAPDGWMPAHAETAKR